MQFLSGKSALLLIVVAVVLLSAIFLSYRRQQAPNPDQRGGTVSKTAEVKSQSPPSKLSEPPGATFSVAEDGTAPVPVRFRLPGVERVRTASNFAEWVSQFPVEQQQKITAFDARHFGVYSVNSAQQVAWMAQMGYPMPEDVIAAEKLTDQNLRDMASHGNDKAGFLLHERDVDALQAKFADAAAQGQNRSQMWANDPSATQFEQDNISYKQLLASSTSPFKGFAKAQDAVLDEDSQYAPANVISALLWSETFGDFRVDQLVQNYVGNDPMRMAMWSGALSMSVNSATDISTLRNLGCPGFNVGNAIPGTVSPVQ